MTYRTVKIRNPNDHCEPMRSTSRPTTTKKEWKQNEINISRCCAFGMRGIDVPYRRCVAGKNHRLARLLQIGRSHSARIVRRKVFCFSGQKPFYALIPPKILRISAMDSKRDKLLNCSQRNSSYIAHFTKIPSNLQRVADHELIRFNLLICVRFSSNPK